MVGQNVDRECTITYYNINRSDPLQAALRSANVDRITDVGDGIADLSRDGGGPLGLPPLPIRHMDVYPRYASHTNQSILLPGALHSNQITFQ